jgi:glycosyltransferase involved in cell wall biosynthesis
MSDSSASPGERPPRSTETADGADIAADIAEIAEIAKLDGRRITIVNWRDPWHPDAGGAEQHAWEIATRLAGRGATVRYLTARPARSQRRQRRDGVEIIRMGGRFTVYPRALAWMLAHRRSSDAVVDVQNGIPFFTPWVVPARVPVLCVMHHVHDAQWGAHFPAWAARVGRILEGSVARRCYRRHACVAVSPSTVAAMQDRLRWPGPVYLIPNGISVGRSPVGTTGGAAAGPAAGPAAAGPAAAGPAAAGPAAAGPAPGPALVWVGRLVAHKRCGRLIDIAERLRGSGATIDVVGHGPEAGSLAAQIERRGVGDVLRMRGYLAEDEKESLVASARLHLNTSQGEGWGLCVLEAAALGVPTVAYDVDGLRDAVQDGITGWLVRDGERIEDVVERALKELSEPGRRARIAGACTAWAAEFDWDRAAGRFAALLAAAIRTGSAQGSRAGAWVIGYPDPEPGRGGSDPGAGPGGSKPGAGPGGSKPGAGPGGSKRSVVAEGPALDVLERQAGRTAQVRPATDVERLLGRTDRSAWR